MPIFPCSVEGCRDTAACRHPSDEKCRRTAPIDLGPGIPRAEQVNHPSHYGGDTTYETVKVLGAWGLGFLLGNTVKYISRAGKKDPSKLVEDLEKAKWYLDKAIEILKAGRPLF